MHTAESKNRRSRLFTIRQTGEELNCSDRSVWRMLAEGKLTKVQLGRAVRVTAESVEAFIAKGGAR